MSSNLTPGQIAVILAGAKRKRPRKGGKTK